MTMEGHMTYLALDRGDDAAKSIREAGKKAAEEDQDAAENIEEALNEASKNLKEAAREQWGNITQETVENIGGAGEDNGNLIFGVFVAVSSTLFVYGICKAVNCFKTEEK